MKTDKPIDLWTVTFAHESLFLDFQQWLASRGLETVLLPSELQPKVKRGDTGREVALGIGICR